MARSIVLRFAAQCFDCGASLSAGSTARWFGKGRVSCCGTDAAAARAAGNSVPHPSNLAPGSTFGPVKIPPVAQPLRNGIDHQAARADVIARQREAEDLERGARGITNTPEREWERCPGAQRAYRGYLIRRLFEGFSISRGGFHIAYAQTSDRARAMIDELVQPKDGGA